MKTPQGLLAAASPRPCPWCGAEPSVVQVSDDPAFAQVQIVCDDNEQCEMSPSLARYGRDAAIAAWNQRSPEYAALLECEQLLRRPTSDSLMRDRAEVVLAAVDKAREEAGT